MFLAQILLARLLGKDEFGSYIYMITWINVIVLLGRLGQDTASVRFVSVYNGQSKWNLLRGYLSYSRNLVLVTSVAISAVLIIITYLMRGHLGPKLSHLFFLGGGLLPVLALVQLYEGYLRGYRRVIVAQLPQQIVLPIAIAVIILIMIGGDIVAIAEVAAVSHIGAMLLALGLGIFLVRSALPDDAKQETSTFLRKQWTMTSGGLLLISGFHMVHNHTDTLMLGAMVDTGTAGVYAIASRMAGLLVFAQVAVNAILSPITAKLYADGRHAELQKIVSRSASIVFVVSSLLGLGLVVFGKIGLGFFGVDFKVAYVPLLVLMAGQMASVLSGQVGAVLSMTGNEYIMALILGVSIVVNIALNALLIPRYGALGAAIATVSSITLNRITLALVTWRKTGIVTIAIYRPAAS